MQAGYLRVLYWFQEKARMILKHGLWTLTEGSSINALGYYQEEVCDFCEEQGIPKHLPSLLEDRSHLTRKPWNCDSASSQPRPLHSSLAILGVGPKLQEWVLSSLNQCFSKHCCVGHCLQCLIKFTSYFHAERFWISEFGAKESASSGIR